MFPNYFYIKHGVTDSYILANETAIFSILLLQYVHKSCTHENIYAPYMNTCKCTKKRPVKGEFCNKKLKYDIFLIILFLQLEIICEV